MSQIYVKSGRVHVGVDCRIGQNVTVNVAEECVIGDRCVIADNTWLEGRRIAIGDDFFGYNWGHPNNYDAGARFSPTLYRGWLEVGRGRIDEEDAVLTVGKRCTFHDNRIDLARRVTIADDVGLSPEVTIYTHGYWMSVIEGFPRMFAPVTIYDGVIVGYRSTILAGVVVPRMSVIAAGSVVAKSLPSPAVIYGGVPAKFIKYIPQVTGASRQEVLQDVVSEWERSVHHRGLPKPLIVVAYPTVSLYWGSVGSQAIFEVNVDDGTVKGIEEEITDDLRWHLFTHGIRAYTKRPFKKLGKR